MKEKPHLGEVEGRAIPAIVVVSIHVEDLLAIDGEEAGEDAFCKACSL